MPVFRAQLLEYTSDLSEISFNSWNTQRYVQKHSYHAKIRGNYRFIKSRRWQCQSIYSPWHKVFERLVKFIHKRMSPDRSRLSELEHSHKRSGSSPSRRLTHSWGFAIKLAAFDQEMDRIFGGAALFLGMPPIYRVVWAQTCFSWVLRCWMSSFE